MSQNDSPVSTVADASPADTSRRGFLKTAAQAGVAVAGITGFPYVHASEKVTLRYLGTAVNQDKAIAEKFEADTGIKIQYIPVTTDDVTKRAVTAPNSFDLIDTEYFSLKKIIPTGNLLGIDTKRIKNWDKIFPTFRNLPDLQAGDGKVWITPVEAVYPVRAWTVSKPYAPSLYP